MSPPLSKLRKADPVGRPFSVALALPVRTVRRLKLLAHLHPPMLDVVAIGSMPNEEQLRTIAAATQDEQAQVWKKHKPKKGQPEVARYEVARALVKRRMPATAAKFGDDLAKAYGVVWEDDLFAARREDSRYTTNVEGFFGAQQEWLQNNLPERGTLLPVNDYGQGQLPKKAERVYSKPSKSDLVGHYIDVRTGEVETIAYRLPEPKKAGQPTDGSKASTSAADGGGVDEETSTVRTRPDVTQKGVAMIGDLRTEALHQALADTPIEDDTLLGLLIVAFGCDNVSVDSGSDLRGDDREAICRAITEGGVLTTDLGLLRQAARQMLVGVLYQLRQLRSLRPEIEGLDRTQDQGFASRVKRPGSSRATEPAGQQCGGPTDRPVPCDHPIDARPTHTEFGGG
jgi:ParB family chromosome partitioning protein